MNKLDQTDITDRKAKQTEQAERAHKGTARFRLALIVKDFFHMLFTLSVLPTVSLIFYCNHSIIDLMFLKLGNDPPRYLLTLCLGNR
jgi:hypothetical protein